uniref:Oligosaccharyltransferase complex subunit n=1 Tax=Sciurus vulgaris TaxID=55149 RepID=A0A8D2ARD8_SCIVU
AETMYHLPHAPVSQPKAEKPPWVWMQSAMMEYALVLMPHFLVTGGMIYDVIKSPSVGSMANERGHQRLVVFLAYTVTGRYIMEGLVSASCLQWEV